MAPHNKMPIHKNRISLSEYLKSDLGEKKNRKQSREEKAHITKVSKKIRTAVENAKVDARSIYVVDLPGRVVAQMHQQAIYLDRKTLPSSTPEEIEHRLRHEGAHVEGVFSEGLVELYVERHNKTGRKFYEDEQRNVKAVTDILSPSGGVQQAFNLYKQRKIKQLYRTFLLRAAKRKIKQPEAIAIFRRAFPELMSHVK